MSEYQTNDPSELVHLFLAGETDSVQQAILFESLAGDSELQLEFQQALELRAATEYDREMTHPPAELTQAVFTGAGFAGVAPATTKGAAAAASRAVFFNKFGSLLLAGITGAIMSALLLTIVGDDKNDGTSARQVGRHTAHTPEIPTVSNFAGSAKGSAVAIMSESSSPSAFASDDERVVVHSPAGRRNAPLSSDADEHDHGASSDTFVHRTAQSDQPAQQMQSVTSDTINDSNVHIDDAVNSIKPAAVRPAALRSLGSASGFSGASIQPASAALRLPTALGDGADITLRIRGLAGLKWYPDRPENGSAAATDNLAIGALYHVDDNHALGLEMGRETLPLFILEGGPLQPRTPINSIFWLGAAYQYTHEPIDALGGLQPFARAFIGGTRSGPLNKAIIGMDYEINDRLSVGLGAEFSALIYQQGDIWFSTEKLGLSYSLQYRF